MRLSIARACWIVVIAIAGVCWARSSQAGAQEKAASILPNASFERAAGSTPSAWDTFTWQGDAKFQVADVGRTGNRSVIISSDAGADAGWIVKVPVKPFSTYRLSGWIKTEDVQPTTGRGALLNLHNIQPAATSAVRGTRDWTKVETVFETGDQDSLQINCLFGGWGLAKGKAWYDDLQLDRLSSETLDPTITIEAGKTGEPISKYVYGQFIEHLGRCIYGGIWAEMLEDRKFWFPVTAQYDPYKKLTDSPHPVVGASPWQIIGADDSVLMIQEDSFVGEHTPLIAAGSGIRQHDLGLVLNKRYVGYVWLKPKRQSTKAVVSLVWGPGPNDRQSVTLAGAGARYLKYPLQFTAGAETNEAALEITVSEGDCYVGTVSLMPEDNVHGMRADTLALLKKLDSPIYRWPGGNFVSGYDWRDGIGDRDRRPPRKNPAWTGVEHNDFGLDEFFTYCRVLGTEPLVVVNSGQGGAAMALEELQYANGGPETPMGKLRAGNGHPEPYGVTWWGIGNEMYGGWQLGHMPLEDYVKKNNQFADAMRAADPSIKLVAVGAVGKWSEGMMQHCADHMDLISEHFYVRDKPGLMAHVRQMTDRVREKARAHRQYRREFASLEGKDIRIALDEWNYWYGPHLYGELGVRYFLRDALGVAAAIHECARNSEMFFMANYAQTVNVIGAIKTSKTDACFAATGLPIMLYRRHFGQLPVATEAGPPLDVMAAWSADRRKLTIGIVNPTQETFDVPVKVQDADLAGSGRLFRIAGGDPMAYNEPGKEPGVFLDETMVKQVGDTLKIAPCSVSLYVLDVK